MSAMLSLPLFWKSAGMSSGILSHSKDLEKIVAGGSDNKIMKINLNNDD